MIFQDPGILEVTFCRKEDYSFLDNLEEPEEKEDEEENSSASQQSQPSQTISSGPGYRKKLVDLKDWKRVLSRTRMSYEAVQQDAMQQVDFFIVSIVLLQKYIKLYFL